MTQTVSPINPSQSVSTITFLSLSNPLHIGSESIGTKHDDTISELSLWIHGAVVFGVGRQSPYSSPNNWML